MSSLAGVNPLPFMTPYTDPAPGNELLAKRFGGLADALRARYEFDAQLDAQQRDLEAQQRENDARRAMQGQQLGLQQAQLGWQMGGPERDAAAKAQAAKARALDDLSAAAGMNDPALVQANMERARSLGATQEEIDARRRGLPTEALGARPQPMPTPGMETLDPWGDAAQRAMPPQAQAQPQPAGPQMPPPLGPAMAGAPAFGPMQPTAAPSPQPAPQPAPQQPMPQQAPPQNPEATVGGLYGAAGQKVKGEFMAQGMGVPPEVQQRASDYAYAVTSSFSSGSEADAIKAGREAGNKMIDRYLQEQRSIRLASAQQGRQTTGYEREDLKRGEDMYLGQVNRVFQENKIGEVNEAARELGSALSTLEAGTRPGASKEEVAAATLVIGRISKIANGGDRASDQDFRVIWDRMTEGVAGKYQELFSRAGSGNTDRDTLLRAKAFIADLRSKVQPQLNQMSARAVESGASTGAFIRAARMDPAYMRSYIVGTLTRGGYVPMEGNPRAESERDRRGYASPESVADAIMMRILGGP